MQVVRVVADFDDAGILHLAHHFPRAVRVVLAFARLLGVQVRAPPDRREHKFHAVLLGGRERVPVIVVVAVVECDEHRLLRQRRAIFHIAEQILREHRRVAVALQPSEIAFELRRGDHVLPEPPAVVDDRVVHDDRQLHAAFRRENPEQRPEYAEHADGEHRGRRHPQPPLQIYDPIHEKPPAFLRLQLNIWRRTGRLCQKARIQKQAAPRAVRSSLRRRRFVVK